MVSRWHLAASEERTRNVPRIAASFLWLGLIVGAVALNMARYPGASQMVSDSCQPQPWTRSSSHTPAPPALSGITVAAGPISPKVEREPVATAEQPARADRMPRPRTGPGRRQGPRNAHPRRPPASARAVPEVPVVQAAVPVEPPWPVDLLDLGNGVRRLAAARV